MGIETLKPETETRPEREAGVVGLPHAGSLSLGLVTRWVYVPLAIPPDSEGSPRREKRAPLIAIDLCAL